jgi:hypothetical protein
MRNHWAARCVAVDASERKIPATENRAHGEIELGAGAKWQARKTALSETFTRPSVCGLDLLRFAVRDRDCTLQ